MNTPRLVPLRIVVWLLWLLAAWGILQYVTHAWKLTHQSGVPTHLHVMLAWDALYVLAAGVVLAAATGVLLWREWARRLLRVLAILLAVYALVSGVQLLAHWRSFSNASVDLIAQAGDPVRAHLLFVQVRRVFMITLVLKALSIPLLAWLAWRLGLPDVKQRFVRSSPAD